MEVIVSLGLVTLITLLVGGVLSKMLFSSGKTAHQTAANLLAEELAESAVVVGPPTWGFSSNDRSTWTGDRILTLPGESKFTTFRYRLEELKARDSDQDLGTFHLLKVTVWWWSEEPTSAIERGKLSVEAHRKVYVRR